MSKYTLKVPYLLKAMFGCYLHNLGTGRCRLKIPQAHGVTVASNRWVQVMSTKNLLSITRTTLNTNLGKSNDGVSNIN